MGENTSGATQQRTEPQLDIITDAIPAFIAYVDRQKRYQFMNRAYYDWFELPAAARGKHAKHILDAETYAVAKPFIDRALAGEAVDYEAILRKPGGDVKYIHTDYIPDIGDDGIARGFVVVGNDITDRKLAEMRLRSSEERFRTLIEQSADAIQLVDESGRLLYSSDSVAKVLGYTPAEIQYVNVMPYIHDEDRPSFMKAWSIVTRRPKAQITVHYRVRHKQGMWVWLETTLTNHLQTPNVQAIVANFRDISKRRQVEEQLRASEARFRFLAESLPEKIFTVRPDGSMGYFNPQWVDYTGVPMEKLLADEAARAAFIHPDDIAPIEKVWKRAMRHTVPAEYQFRMLRTDGMYRWHMGRMNPMKDAEGKVSVWVGSVTDIDDMKRSAQRRHELEVEAATLAEQRTQLLALNQAKDEFISLASHQLRTPATGVKQYLGMLLEGYAGALNDDQMAFLETAYESNERQINIVNDLLQVARIDAGKVALRRIRTDVVKMVKNVLNEHASQFQERDQKVSLRCKAERLFMPADPDKLRMVLDNVIDNASKYTEPGKKIVVSIRELTGKVSVAIADQGIGMTEEEIGRIFQKFSRIENPQAKGVEGSGLGLYWAKKIVDLHGGTIKVRSASGKGTKLTITLPV